MTTHIRVSEPVKDTIKSYKEARGHTNMDSAVREILMRANVEIQYDEEVESEEEDDSSEDDLDSIWRSK